jgi:hypothetical protein
VAVTVLAAAPGARAAQPLPDQSLLPTGPAGRDNLSALVGAGFAYAGQTFTPSISGVLSSAELYLARVESYSGPWEVSVRPLDASGLPTAQVLASRTLTAGDLPTTLNPIESAAFPLVVSFDAPAPVVAGVPLALVAKADGTTGGFSGAWYGLTSAAYPGGRAAFGTAADEWAFNGPGNDLFFRTFVTPVPEPAYGLALAAGVPLVLRPPRRGRLA